MFAARFPLCIPSGRSASSSSPHSIAALNGQEDLVNTLLGGKVNIGPPAANDLRCYPGISRGPSLAGRNSSWTLGTAARSFPWALETVS